MDVSVRLKDVMRKTGIPSAKKLSEMSGVSQTMISKILRGASMPTTTTLEMLCKAMRITMRDFFSVEEKEDRAKLRAQVIGVETNDFLIALLDETEELNEKQLSDILEYARYIKYRKKKAIVPIQKKESAPDA